MSTARVMVLALTVAAASCGGLDVTTDWDQSFNFQAAQTFTVLDEAGGQTLNQLNNARVRTSITNAMEAKGLREVADTSQADLAVGYQFTSQQKSTYSTVNTGWGGYGYGGFGGWYGAAGPMMSTSTTTENDYDVGSLVIAVFDTDARQMVYTGTGTQTLPDGQQNPSDIQQRIDSAVTEILGSFPPGS